MKKALPDKEKVIKMLWDKRKVAVRTPVTIEEYDYWDLKDDDFIHNTIVGFTTVGKMRELKKRGVLIYDQCWRIPTQICLNYKGETRFRPTDLYLEYRKKNFRIVTQAQIN